MIYADEEIIKTFLVYLIDYKHNSLDEIRVRLNDSKKLIFYFFLAVKDNCSDEIPTTLLFFFSSRIWNESRGR